MDGLPQGSLETFHDSLKSLVHDRWWFVVVIMVIGGDMVWVDFFDFFCYPIF